MTNVNFNENSIGNVNSTVDAFAVTNNGSGPALRGESVGGFTGIFGTSRKTGITGVTGSDTDAGVNGSNTGKGFGVFGGSQSGHGIEGHSVESNGVKGFSEQSDAVCGFTGAVGKAGVLGLAPDGNAVAGISDRGIGVHGTNGPGGAVGPDRGCGILGDSTDGYGVFGSSDNHFGIKAVSKTGVGLSAEGARLAAFFRGDVEITGDIRFINGAGDLAEEFAIAPSDLSEPGTVMALNAKGELQPSQRAFEKGVVGVISGAGTYRPALVLDRQEAQDHRKPIALVGKVYCKADAQYGSIEVGDLLTTSPTAGHAMKANDPLKAFGAVIGKALRPLEQGQGMIPILIALQ